MRTRILVAVLLITTGVAVHAQLSGAARTPRSTTRDAKSQALYDWANHMGMLRGVNENDAIATLELRGTATIDVAGQACRSTDYHESVNYQQNGVRVAYTCTKPDGSTYKTGEVVRDAFAWNEDGPVGAGLVPGRGTAIPVPNLLTDRLIRLWSSPQGSVKAAVRGGAMTTVAVDAGKTIVTYPIPGVAGATAKATLTGGAPNGLCTRFCAERIEVRVGTSVTEFTYSNYADYNPTENKLDAFYAGRMIEKKNGATVRDITVRETQTANLYIVIPVPASVRDAAPRQAAAQ